MAAPLAGRIERMMVKLGVKSIRIETIAKLVDAGLITKLADIFTLDPAAVAAVPGLGVTSATQICAALQEKLAKGLWDWEILASAGILSVGKTLSRAALTVGTLETYLTDPASLTMPLAATVGPERSRMVLEGFIEFATDIRDLMALGPVRATRALPVATPAATPYKVVITGELRYWDRDVFKDYIESLGHKVVGSVSKKTDYLITNTPTSGTVKNKRAQELGVAIITELEAVERLGLTLPTDRDIPADTNGDAPRTPQIVSLDDL